MPRSFMVSVAAFAIVAFAQGAVAAPDALVVRAVAPTSNSYITKQTVVRYGDLNVADAQGAAALYDRIDDAARRTCGARQNFAFQSDMAARIERCRIQAVKSAIAQVASPALTQVAAAKK